MLKAENHRNKAAHYFLPELYTGIVKLDMLINRYAIVFFSKYIYESY